MKSVTRFLAAKEGYEQAFEWSEDCQVIYEVVANVVSRTVGHKVVTEILMACFILNRNEAKIVVQYVDVAMFRPSAVAEKLTKHLCVATSWTSGDDGQDKEFGPGLLKFIKKREARCGSPYEVTGMSISELVCPIWVRK